MHGQKNIKLQQGLLASSWSTELPNGSFQDGHF